MKYEKFKSVIKFKLSFFISEYKPFLQTILGLGLELNKAIPDNRFISRSTPILFPVSVLEYVKATYSLTDSDIEVFVSEGIVCFPSGCVDPGDPGWVCCPFTIDIEDEPESDLPTEEV